MDETNKIVIYQTENGETQIDVRMEKDTVWLSQAASIRNSVQEKVLAHDWALQLHGFYVDIPNKFMRCDVVMSFDMDHAEGIAQLQKELAAMLPGYTIHITPDVDVSD